MAYVGDVGYSYIKGAKFTMNNKYIMLVYETEILKHSISMRKNCMRNLVE
jgi:hypothetical protein